jgi:2-polyprenyl-6-methoxyphenol hydroxylase-like FAD-dependent oxidoreductase
MKSGGTPFLRCMAPHFMADYRTSCTTLCNRAIIRLTLTRGQWRSGSNWPKLSPHPRSALLPKKSGVRSFVAERLRFGRLFLAGDAAHIVPQTGANVINLAFADVHDLAEALREKHDNNGVTLEAYSLTCLSRISKAQRFSWWVTSLLHLFTMPLRSIASGRSSSWSTS